MRALNQRVAAACEQDPSIVMDRSEIMEQAGHSLSYFAMLGLSKQDLKKLERHGLAVRGYVWRFNQYGKRDGFETRFLLVVDRG